jgi:hypothetical protein
LPEPRNPVRMMTGAFVARDFGSVVIPTKVGVAAVVHKLGAGAAWRRSRNAAVVTVGSGSFSFDVHGHLSPPGQPVGVPDPEWVERIRTLLQRNAIADLIEEATPERFSRAGNVSGELLNWIAMLGTLGGHKLEWIQPEPQFGNSYAVWS